MKAKTLLLAVTITALALSAQAQETTTFGIRAGVNFQNLNGKDYNDDDLENKIKTGFHKLSAQLNAQPGMLKVNPGIDGLTNDKSKWKNTGFGLSLGYRFNYTYG